MIFLLEWEICWRDSFRWVDDFVVGELMFFVGFSMSKLLKFLVDSGDLTIILRHCNNVVCIHLVRAVLLLLWLGNDYF